MSCNNRTIGLAHAVSAHPSWARHMEAQQFVSKNRQKGKVGSLLGSLSAQF